MSIARLLRHLIAPQWLVSHAFPRATLDRIEAAIHASESSHRGEIRFVVEAGLDLLPLLRGITPRDRAVEVFSQQRVWDTEQNCGVLVYVQFVDHDIEIVADRGISAKVAQHEWDAVCARMEQAFRAGDFERGALAGIAGISALLQHHFPAEGKQRDELANRPLLI